MRTKTSTIRLAALTVAGALTTVFAGGCITHPPGKTEQRADTSKEATTVHRRKHHITHPPGASRDGSKDGPLMTEPAPITHPGG